MILTVKNSNKFQKTRFWNEKLVEDMVTLGPTSQVTLVKMMRSNVSMQILELRLF
jgi:hypothetical protein